MLSYLRIENFALIDELDVDFGSGLTLITGETGSGKSILVDAVALLMGERASQEMIREGSDSARVEGIFRIPGEHPVRARLEEAGITLEDDELIIRRDIHRSGSNRVFMNGSLNNLGQLTAVAEHLGDIHGQHDQQQLLNPRTHLAALDTFAQVHRELEAVRSTYRSWQEKTSALQRLQSSEADRLRKQDLLRYQIAEIEKLNLRPDSEEDLLSERRLLSTAERRSQLTQEAYFSLYESEDSLLGGLDRVQRLLTELSSLDPSFSQPVEKIAEARFQLDEISFQLRDAGSSIEHDPARLEEVEERLAELQKAKRKYGNSVKDILAFLDHARIELHQIENAEIELGELINQVDALERDYLELAGVLSAKRHQSASKLARRVEGELAELAMGNTAFRVDLKSGSTPTEEGTDEAEFLFSANPGEAPRPLAKIASGGELSRVVLAFKSIVNVDGNPKTLVFDEVDAGIGGRVASVLGEKLAHLAKAHQVFCVTHLPQIAARADHHFRVGKYQNSDRTLIQLERLNRSERVQEIARMLAGESVTATTLKQAEELLAAHG